MNDQQASASQHLIEEMSIFFEQSGMPRMAGRILSHLLLCVPPHQSFDELATTLQASKGSISTMTRLLIHTGLIERIGLPGQRRDYFRIKPGAWSHLLRTSLTPIGILREMAERGLALLADEPPTMRQRLEEMRDLYTFFERELPALLLRWEQERASAQQSTEPPTTA